MREVKKRGDSFSRLKFLVLRRTRLKRTAFFLLMDAVSIALSMYLAFWLRFDGLIPAEYARNLGIYIAAAEVVVLGILALCRCHSICWKFFSPREGLRLLMALTLGTLLLGIWIYFLGPGEAFAFFPRSVFIIQIIMTMGFIGSLRVSKRFLWEYRNWKNVRRKGKLSMLIVGAGAAGEQIVREMTKDPRSKYWPVGLIDDNISKIGMSLHGVKVLGDCSDIPKLFGSYKIDEVLIAMPSVPSVEIREIVHCIRECDPSKKVKTLPGIIDLMNGNVELKDIKEIRIEDLLGRVPVTIDYAAIREFLAGKRVLITGGGGSIGGELVRTVQAFNPKTLVVLDLDETELFNLVNRLKPAESDLFPVVGDVRDRAKMTLLFQSFRPQVVIHSAAYKHVPILESFPEEAVRTNILGTKILGELAAANGVETFVNISTDKAINPTSVMGVTKRVAEEFLRALNGMNGTRFISVRFGNVLGSRGSVIPLFQAQIRMGGPVTVTHPDMKRYFMAVSEAVLLVLVAAANGEGGETCVLDMGEPVKIVDLARDMIRLSHLEPDIDIPIVFTGLRPGEKLFEELLGAEEGSEPTKHPKVFKARNAHMMAQSAILEVVERLINLSREGGLHRDDIIRILKEIVPTYGPVSAAPHPPSLETGVQPSAPGL